MAPPRVRLRGFLGGVIGKHTGIPITPELLQELGDALVRSLAKESKTYFEKRGWSGQDPNGGPPIWKSFKATVRGQRTLEITSTFYGMRELASGDIPERKMTWLTQEAKDRNPGNYPLTPRERELGMKQTGRVSRGARLPLVVPVQSASGKIEFRTAPLTLGEAWVHPGIAKFTFFDVAVKNWRKDCEQILTKALIKTLSSKQASSRSGKR